MKKIIISLILSLTALLSVSAYAEDEITVTINGTPLVSDVAPQIVNDRTMLPMRAIFEALGANVTWMGEDKLIFATKGDSMIVLQIDNPKMSVQKIGNDENIGVNLDTPPYIKDDRTMVPVRAIAESLDAKVEWLGETKTVVITQ